MASDFRLVAWTYRALDEMVEKGHFRKDLLYRLRVFAIELPPLRERKGDLQVLTLRLIERMCRRVGLEPMGCSPEFLFGLAQYHWPGNVRELVHALERAVAAAADEGVLHVNHLPEKIRFKLVECVSNRGAAQTGAEPVSLPKPTPSSFAPLRDVREAAVRGVEINYLTDLLAHVQGDVQEICRIADLSRSRLYALLEK